jgi:predicted permease
MSLISEVRIRMRALFRSSAMEREMNDELRDHLEREVAQLVARGVAVDEARRRARAQFGSIDYAAEGMRDERGSRWVEDFARDVRLGLRALRRTPLFTTAAVLTLGLGIAVATSVFSVVSMMLLRPLPVPAAERLVVIGMRSEGERGISTHLSYPVLQELRGLTDVFESVVAYTDETVSLRFVDGDGSRSGASGEVRYAQFVTGNYFTALGLSAPAGRVFTAAEDDRAEQVAVLAHNFWTERFTSDPGVIGRTVHVNGVPYAVIGVAPASFHGLESLVEADAYFPLRTMQLAVPSLAGVLDRINSEFLRPVAVLRSGKSAEDAASVLAVLAGRLVRDNPDAVRGLAFVAAPERYARPVIAVAEVVPVVAATFMMLVLLALVIACINVANLVLARTMARRTELAVRHSLGASRGRVVRQLLTESLLLGAGGLALGLVIARFVVAALANLEIAADLPLFIDARLDWRVFAFAGLTCVVATAVAGAVPALRGARAGLADAVREGRQGSSGSGRTRRGSGCPHGHAAHDIGRTSHRGRTVSAQPLVSQSIRPRPRSAQRGDAFDRPDAPPVRHSSCPAVLRAARTGGDRAPWRARGRSCPGHADGLRQLGPHRRTHRSARGERCP